ncbi:hypothetical protein IX318_001767 [Porphyromonas levii]|uniref:ParA family protein n=2 Tax=Porphyromonas levii TaxID=28114 RepID=UPI001DCD1FD2|nr:ParA family protein [Porphyromonas levii]MBR8713885.1 hypothetical protein [Porphyromonas levii]MBR8715895.1 hypothetical protein [Porphyromonas levii]MBR8728443.1 hypothetical protein [Porphyromonas levii]MBR8736757.1 hypothetical protein [Porphyromonas levii]MBR8778837.1 hypothetical protein [Porphyromonas levii]
MKTEVFENILKKREKMKQNSPIYLGFASQKGGVGKSTLAEVLAAILYYEKGIDLVVADCDGTQESFFKLRERERALVSEDPDIALGLKKHFEQFKKPSYQILRANTSNALSEVKNFISSGKGPSLQLVIFDFPGHAGTSELLNLSIEMDYIVSPIEADVQSLTSSLAYAKTIQDIGVSMNTSRIKEIMLLWNKIDRRARNIVVTQFSDYIIRNELSLFENKLYNSVKFARELSEGGVRGVFRSTYLPPHPNLRSGTGVDEWVAELLSRINLQTIK